MPALWTIAANPRKRRRSGKHRSAAQRAATRRLVAMNRTRRNPRRVKRSRARSSIARVVRRRTSRIRSVARRARRSVNRSSFRMTGGSAMALIKAGAIGAGGALTVDVAMGFVNGFLPANMNSKLNVDGSVNYLNYAAKGALAIALAHFGGKVVSRDTAARMATGSFVVMAYELLRPLATSVLPASMSLGWYQPGRTMNPAGRTMGMYQRLGNYQNLTRSNVTPMVSPNAVAARTGR